jgi:hypothetical protein
MATLAWPLWAEPAPKLSSPISSETVKPMPASRASPKRSIHFNAGVQAGAGGFGDQERGAENAHSLAHHQCCHDAHGHRIPERGTHPVDPPRATPAEKNAKTGTAKPAEKGRRQVFEVLHAKCPRQPWFAGVFLGGPLAATGTAKPNRTPATVAWMPEAWTKPQVASGQRHQQVPAADSLLDQEREEGKRHQGGQEHEPAGARWSRRKR